MAAESDSSAVSLRAIDDVLAGRNAAANEAIAGLMRKRWRMSRPRIAPPSPPSAATWSAWRARTCWAEAGRDRLYPDRSLQARKELNALGLTYHDSKQFLDAVKRNDTLAAELFIAGRGVDLSATDFWGRDAVDFARRNHNEPLAQLILRSRPATR